MSGGKHSTEPDSEFPCGAGCAGRRRLLAATFILVTFTCAYVRNTRPGWGVNSRFALTCAIVEQGSLSIDDYHDRPETATGDKAFFDGRFYCDKSPVTSFLGLIPMFAFRLFRPAGADYDMARYWTTLGTAGLSAGLLAVMLAILLGRAGLDDRLAAAAAALWIIGTPLFGYAVLFFDYLPASAMAAGSMVLLESPSEENRPRASRLFAAGLLLGLASWTLATFALLALILTIRLAARVTPRRLIHAWPWALGGVVGASGYAIYSLALFGEIANPYKFEFDPKFREEMSRGLMGATLPDPRVLLLITVHPFRGLFVLFPATLVALAGCGVAIRTGRDRASAAVALAFTAGLLLHNAGYFMWWGGWSYAPRHLIPALVPLCVGLARALDGPRPAVRRAAWALLIVSAVGNVAVVSLDPQHPPDLRRPPLLDESALMAPGSVESWPTPYFTMLANVFVHGQTDANLGTAFGLRGAWSLAPLALAWLIFAAALLKPRAGRP